MAGSHELHTWEQLVAAGYMLPAAGW